MNRVTIFYATREFFKKEELDLISEVTTYVSPSGESRPIEDLIEFRVSDVTTDEPLEIDLVQMVRHKARSAYRRLLLPCIVEHAGLIFDAFSATGFPGGLTQPMWDALPVDDFLSRTGCAGERATARAVVGFCDGMRVRTFIGDTEGTIAQQARGAREFYWDPIFCPNGGDGRTYAEITSSGRAGLIEKLHLSQSAKALAGFATYLAAHGNSGLFDLR